MKILVIYDSVYGNTEKVAQVIYDQLSRANSTNLLRVSEVQKTDLVGINMLVLGSPTHGGRPTPGMQGFMDGIQQDVLIGVKVATFDTRLKEEDQNFALRLLMKTIGYASDKMMQLLEKNGGKKIAVPAGFMVTKKEGPIKAGEIEKAKDWAMEMLSKVVIEK